MNTLPLLDQSQCAAVREHLLLQCAALGATVTRLTGETATQPKLTGDEIQDVETLKAHAASLQSKLDLVVPAKAPKAETPKPTPARMPANPLSTTERIAVTPEQAQAVVSALETCAATLRTVKPSATAQVLARRGAKDLDELNAKAPKMKPGATTF